MLKLQSIICGGILANKATKPLKSKWHLYAKHKEKKILESPNRIFWRKDYWNRKPQKGMFNILQVNMGLLGASYKGAPGEEAGRTQHRPGLRSGGKPCPGHLLANVGRTCGEQSSSHPTLLWQHSAHTQEPLMIWKSGYQNPPILNKIIFSLPLDHWA